MDQRMELGAAARQFHSMDLAKNERTRDSVGVAVKGCSTADRSPDLGKIPESVRATLTTTPGVYDARRLRSQREIIRDVMLSAAECGTWLTLEELRSLTRYGEASISAQLRHLRKSENGGFDVTKRHREGALPDRPGTDGRGECIWEYRIARGVESDGTNDTRLLAAGA